MDQRVGTKHRQHVHVLLRMVQLMEAPEHSDAVICKMDEPVQTVHRDDDQGDRTPAWKRADPRQDDPRQTPGRTTATKERVSAVTSGATSTAFMTVRRRS